MTALCGGGTSGPKVLPELAATYGAGRLAQLLVGAGLGELSAWLPLVGLIPVVYSAFCAVDPPTMTALTQAESDALANNTFGADFISGLGKFKDVLLYLIWNDVCQCTSGTFTAVTIPAVDANTPVYKQPTTPSNTPCATQLTNTSKNLPINRSLIAEQFHWLGLTPTLVRFVASNTLITSPGFPVRVDFTLINEAHTSNTFTTHANLNPGQSTDFNVAIPAGSGWVRMDYNDDLTGGSGAGTGSGASRLDARYELWCGSIPGSVQQPCCPPDAATQAYLDLILNQVNLIQRQAVPFGYIPGTAHTGLSGAGTVSVQGLIGAKAVVTTLPGQYGSHGTSPTEYFDLGFLTWGTADGYPQSYKLDKASLLMLPVRAGVFTEIDYDLAPGVVVTLTELTREP